MQKKYNNYWVLTSDTIKNYFLLKNSEHSVQLEYEMKDGSSDWLLLLRVEELQQSRISHIIK